MVMVIPTMKTVMGIKERNSCLGLIRKVCQLFLKFLRLKYTPVKIIIAWNIGMNLGNS